MQFSRHFQVPEPKPKLKPEPATKPKAVPKPGPKGQHKQEFRMAQFTDFFLALRYCSWSYPTTNPWSHGTFWPRSIRWLHGEILLVLVQGGGGGSHLLS